MSRHDDDRRPGSRLAHLRFPARADQLCQVRGLVRDAALRAGASDALTHGVVLAVDEACANVIRHGYGAVQGGDIILDVLSDGDDLVFRIRDFAPPVNPDRLSSRDLDKVRPGGLGVHLIREIMDTFEFLATPDGVGNLLEMRKHLHSAE